MLRVENLRKAIELYYSRTMLNASDIGELFGGACPSTVHKLKVKAREKMAELGLPIWDSFHVDTKAAYLAWGLDIADIEKRYKKLQSYGMAPVIPGSCEEVPS